MIHVARKTFRCIQRLALVVAMLAPFASNATVKALSFAINEPNTSSDATPIRTYMGQNAVDFGVFDTAKAPGYFINADFTSEGRNFKVSYYKNGNVDYKFVIYDSDKYELVNVPEDDKSSNNVTGVFEDKYGDQFALISLRGSYSASSVKTYLDGIAAKYPTAKLIVTYNARVGSSSADTLNASLTDSVSGPGLTCLGRTDVAGTAIGGVYMDPDVVPSTYSVSLVPQSIGTKYDGTLATIGFPAKCTVIFNDWDGTGLQTNIVFAGESVTPPIPPERSGYTFTGWDRPASDFTSVPESFTATAQYASNAASLLVRGDPEDLGTADPAYGSTTDIAANDMFTATVSAPNAEEGATERWVCVGYAHYEITDLATGAKSIAQEGDTNSFTYTHIYHDELVWRFTNEWLVSASATLGGSVSVSESWVRNGEALAIVATPAEGWEFLGWRGDTNGIANVSSASIAPIVTAARTLKAAFVPVGADMSVQYVATTGDDANSGYDSESPKLTIQAAVNTLAEAAGHGTVHVAPGLYAIPISAALPVSDKAFASVVITNAISVIGDPRNPEDVIVRNTSTYNTAQVIVFYINHPDALVANLTVEQAHRNAPESPFGGNVSINTLGGTVSNCILRAANSIGNYARGTGAWLNSDAALLTHCVVTNNTAIGSGYQYTEGIGIFVHVARGTVANCLIANNHDSGGTGAASNSKQAWSNGVAVDNGALLNCTVATNEARYTAGVYLHPNGCATNVVVAGCVNKCAHPTFEEPAWSDIGFKGSLDNASHCASDGGEELDSTCIAGTAAEFFLDMAGRDYRPAKNSPLINKGVAYEGIASFDLLGKKRVQGRVPDIGAYETAPRHMTVCIR